MWAGWTVRGIESRWGRDFPHLSKPALVPTQPPVTIGTESFPGVKSGRGVTLIPHPLLVPWSRKSRAIPSDWLRAGRSGYRIPVGARFSAPVHTGPGTHFLYNVYRVFWGVKSGRGMTLTPHPLLVPWSRKNRAIPLLPLWAVRPVQSLSASTVRGCTLPYLYMPSWFGQGRVWLSPSWAAFGK